MGLNDKFKFIEKNEILTKDNKNYYTIRIFVSEIEKSVVIFVSESIYKNYKDTKFNDTIPDNKIVKQSYVNKFGALVSTYKLVN